MYQSNNDKVDQRFKGSRKESQKRGGRCNEKVKRSWMPMKLSVCLKWPLAECNSQQVALNRPCKYLYQTWYVYWPLFTYRGSPAATTQFFLHSYSSADFPYIHEWNPAIVDDIPAFFQSKFSCQCQREIIVIRKYVPDLLEGSYRKSVVTRLPEKRTARQWKWSARLRGLFWQ